MTSKPCPVCDEGMLGFIAHPTAQDDEIVAVIATCTHCRYSFFYHLPFEKMLTEVVITVDAEEEDARKKPPRFTRLKLVKTQESPRQRT